MKHIPFYFFALLLLVLQFSCQKDNSPVSYENTSSSVLGDINLFTFSPDSVLSIGNPIHLELDSETKIADVLDTLGKYLSQTYFYKTYTNTITNIKFEVKNVEEIQTPIRPFRIATIDFIDPQELAMGYFFQGSSGGYITTCMIAAHFTQPQLRSNIPLLDGLVILYNGQVLYEMDHVNFGRIITPGEFRQAVFNAFTKK